MTFLLNKVPLVASAVSYWRVELPENESSAFRCSLQPVRGEALLWQWVQCSLDILEKKCFGCHLSCGAHSSLRAGGEGYYTENIILCSASDIQVPVLSGTSSIITGKFFKYLCIFMYLSSSDLCCTLLPGDEDHLESCPRDSVMWSGTQCWPRTQVSNYTSEAGLKGFVTLTVTS